jgi:hypothetical protein
MELDARTGAFLWVPTEEQVGTHQLTFRATDRESAIAEQSVSITVQDVNRPPTDVSLSATPVWENLSGAIVGNLTATDPDSQQVHVFQTTDPRFEIAGAVLRFRDSEYATYGDSGLLEVEITATDSGTPAKSRTQIVRVEIAPNPRAWFNTVLPQDTDGDGHVVPQDALRIINRLNDGRGLESNGKLPLVRRFRDDPYWYDTNGDGLLTTNDVLRVVNYLNAVQAEGEAIVDGISSPLTAEKLDLDWEELLEALARGRRPARCGPALPAVLPR